MAEGTSNTDKLAKELVSTHKQKFDISLNDDLDTPLALSIFYNLIKMINWWAADEKITKTSSDIILPEFERMIDVLGIHIPKVSDREKDEINDLIIKRNEYRKQKNFEDADVVRDQLAEKNIIIIDHKNSTKWIKQEKIKAG